MLILTEEERNYICSWCDTAAAGLEDPGLLTEYRELKSQAGNGIVSIDLQPTLLGLLQATLDLKEMGMPDLEEEARIAAALHGRIRAG